MRPALLFDMDGTLIDSAAGMRLSLNYALTSAGLPTIAEEEAGKYLGPPLEYSLTTFPVSYTHLDVYKRQRIALSA